MMPITWKLEPAHILELLLESAPVGITVLTTDLKYVVVSRTVAEEFVQLPEKEILGRYCYDVIGTYRDDPDKEGPDPSAMGVRPSAASLRGRRLPECDRSDPIS